MVHNLLPILTGFLTQVQRQRDIGMYERRVKPHGISPKTVEQARCMTAPALYQPRE